MRPRRTLAGLALGVSLLASGLVLSGPVSAQVVVERDVIVVRQGGVTEAMISACAGGAAIGAVIVWGSGTGAVLPTAGLFCGLSVAATISASVATDAWRALPG